MDIRQIKLVIWDLDETLWKGTLSEGDVVVKEPIAEFLRNTLDMGIVHSICSKNDFRKTKDKLSELGLWDIFVFPSIDWTPKGVRVKETIENMGLRPGNVLFVDDNMQNLEEVKYYCGGGIMTALPDQLDGLIQESRACEKTDTTHKRLAQYRLLQRKEAEKNQFDSNTDFLMSCNIRVEICRDCLENIDRIHELLMRSNQLNYTKFRQGKEDLRALIQQADTDAGYVRVSDRFGDYGIVGFFAVRDHRAIHYLFSCRTLGMAVEQYVYMQIGCPELEVVGEVVSPVNDRFLPEWINRPGTDTRSDTPLQKHVSGRVVIKGPCDLSQMSSFIHFGDNVETEFTYVNDKGGQVEGHNHTGQIVTALYASEQRKREIIDEIDWFDEKMLSTHLADKDVRTVVMSLLADGNLGVYRRKATGELVSLCEKYYDLTDPNTWELYINKKIFTSDIVFTRQELEKFSQRYEYVPNDGSLTIDSLDKIYSRIKGKRLILIMGSEQEFHGKTKPNYEGRAALHRHINGLVKQWAADKSNVILLPLDKYIQSEDDFLDTINHFKKSVYYRFAEDMISLLNDGEEEMGMRGKGRLFYEVVRQKTEMILRKMGIYKKVRGVWRYLRKIGKQQ